MRLVLALALVMGSALSSAQDKPAADKPAAAPAGPTVRPEVGQPLQAALDHLKARRTKEALAKAREAQAVPNKTPYETYMATRVLGQAAAAAGEAATAAAALENAAASTAAPEAERRQLLAAAAAQYYALKDYAKAATLAGRYAQQGGSRQVDPHDLRAIALSRGQFRRRGARDRRRHRR